MFNPSLSGHNVPGIQQMFLNSINKTDPDLRKTLYNNIVLSGGSTMFNGISQRVTNEIKKFAPQGAQVKVIAAP